LAPACGSLKLLFKKPECLKYTKRNCGMRKNSEEFEYLGGVGITTLEANRLHSTQFQYFLFLSSVTDLEHISDTVLFHGGI
jgi:hypothetical protein